MPLMAQTKVLIIDDRDLSFLFFAVDLLTPSKELSTVISSTSQMSWALYCGENLRLLTITCTSHRVTMRMASEVLSRRSSYVDNFLKENNDGGEN